MSRLPSVLLASWIMLAMVSSLTYAALIPGPLVILRAYSDSCSGPSCVYSFYNVPNQCNPLWASDGTISTYSMMSEVCSMSAGICNTTRYNDAACTISPRVRVLIFTSVGVHANGAYYWTYTTDGGVATAPSKPFIFIEQRTLLGTSSAIFGNVQTLVIPNVAGCQPIYTQGASSAFLGSARVATTCADDDEFVQLAIFPSTDCSAPSGSSSMIADLSARVGSHNGSLATPSYYSGGVQTLAKCYGGITTTTKGSNGVVYFSTSNTSCDAPTGSSWFENAAEGACVPLMVSGLNATVSTWIKILHQCTSADYHLSYDAYTTNDCSGTAKHISVTLDACNRDLTTAATYQCLTKISSPTSLVMVTLNLSRSDAVPYHTYALENSIQTCQPAYSLSGDIDFYFVSSYGCRTNPLYQIGWTMYSDSTCTILLTPGTLLAMGQLVTALNSTFSYAISCPNAASSTPTALIVYEILGTDSCTASTPSGIYKTMYSANQLDCTAIYNMDSSLVGYASLSTLCYPENEFQSVSFYSDAACSQDGSLVTLPLGSDRCYNLPTGAVTNFGSRALRAKCYNGDNTGSALSYAFIEEYTNAEDCESTTSKVSPARSFPVAQSTSQSMTVPLWAPSSTVQELRFSEFCHPDDPVAWLSVSSDGGSSWPTYAWKATRNMGTTTQTTTYETSASVYYPPQCNIAVLDGVRTATKITCFGTYLASSTVRNIAVTSGINITRISGVVGAETGTCYASWPVSPNDVLTLPATTFSHACSPLDSTARFLTSDSGVCPTFVAANSSMVELGVAQINGDVLDCYQYPTAAAASSDSYYQLNVFGSSDCSGSLSQTYTLENTAGICQATSSSTGFILAEKCYEDDPFMTVFLYSDASCTTPTSNLTLRQGSSNCNSGTIASVTIRCISPTNSTRPPSVPSAYQSKIWLGFKTSGGTNETVVIDNAPSVTNTTCLPAISSVYGTSNPVYYVRLTDGRCSSEDVLAHISTFNESTCSYPAMSTRALYLGETTTNSVSNTNWTMSCYTDGQTVEPKSQSVVVRTAFSDPGCGFAPLTTVALVVPNTCTPIETPHMTSGPSLWVKSSISCGKASADTSGFASMDLNYYTSSTCSASSKYTNTGHVYPRFTNTTEICSIGSVFAPLYSTSSYYQCAQTRTYQDPCPGMAPSDLFHCLNGAWVASGSISTETVTIGSSTTAVISGNLNVSTSIVVTGVSSSLTVTECLYLNGSVSITLTSEDIELLTSKYKSYIILSYDGENCTDSSDLSTTSVTISSANSGCKKLKTSNQSTKQTLALAFSLDDSGCSKSRWWIILVAVIAAFVVIVVVVVLLATFVPSVRNCIRPYSKKRTAAGMA